jgi:penicillin-binding protein 1A
MLKRIFWGIFFLSIICSLVGGIFVYRYYIYITRDLPNFSSIDDYNPPAVTKVFAHDGTLMAELYKERRYPVKLKDVPLMVRNCFLAAEDTSFYSHPGIDIFSIIRAAVKNFRSGKSTQGGSTITQQVVKNLLLTPEKNIKRKIKEAILSYRLEKRLSKDEIFEIYLNQIFFGNNAYGIVAASKAYFHKELNELTLGEAAVLGGLPKAPSKYSPLLNMTRAKIRQRYVLNRMVTAKFATEEEADAAAEQPIKVYQATAQNIFHSPYYVTEVRDNFLKQWKQLDIDSDGLEITTAADIEADHIATEALQEGLRVVDKRRGWRGPLSVIPSKKREDFTAKYGARTLAEITEKKLFPAMVAGVSPTKDEVSLDLGKEIVQLPLSPTSWAKRRLYPNDRRETINLKSALTTGSVIEVSLNKDQKLQIDQTPEIEGAFTLLDPYTGRVAAMVGGYSYERSQFNRVTQALRQPGSAFKPIIYLSAIDGFDYTPSTIVSDEPRTFKWGDDFWTPHNFDSKFLGAITLQTALEKSRNLVSADIVSKIGVDAPIQYARRLGITTPIGRNLSLSLGSSEVTMLELARAYGAIAARGMLTDTVLMTKIKDRKGNVLFDDQGPQPLTRKQVVNEESAFVLSHMMRGVVDRGTATVIKPLGRPVAGKTGTTNNHMDAWFVGFTPRWVAAVWAGFDVKRDIGDKETGGKVSAPIWLNFMQQFLPLQDGKTKEEILKEAEKEKAEVGISIPIPETMPIDQFRVPLGVQAYWIDRATGHEVTPNSSSALLEYFKNGTEPRRSNASEDEAGNGESGATESYLDTEM